MTLRVLTAVAHRWETGFVTALDSAGELTLVRRCADLPDLVAAAAAGLADLAVVSADLRGLDRDALSQLQLHGVHVVGALAPGDEEGERRLRQLGIGQYVRLDAGVEDIEEVLGAAARPGHGHRTDALDALLGGTGGLDGGVDGVTEGIGTGAYAGPAGPGLGGPAAGGTRVDGVELGPGLRRGRIIAVWGPTGAPGRTTIAVNLAAELAAGGVATLLADLDTYGASIAQALSLLDEAPGMAAACRGSEQGTLDLPVLARLAPSVGSNLRVLTGIPRSDRWPELRAAAVEHVLGLARQLADLVVLDCGFSLEDDEELSYDTFAPRRNATTLVALEQADELLVVGSADPVGLQRLVRAVQDVGTIPSPAPQVVVNRVRQAAVGSRPERRIAQALARFAGMEDLRFVPFEPDTLDAAMLAGRSLVEHAPKSAVRQAIGGLARRLAPAPAPAR